MTISSSCFLRKYFVIISLILHKHIGLNKFVVIME